jgi:repressor of nif and glnA expression
MAKTVLPESFVHWYRRRRAIRRYLRELGYEIYDRQVRMQLEDLEGRILARRTGFHEQLVKDVLDRTDLVLQELDRRIEGLSTRHGKQLRELREEIAALRASVDALASRPDPARVGASPPE